MLRHPPRPGRSRATPPHSPRDPKRGSRALKWWGHLRPRQFSSWSHTTFRARLCHVPDPLAPRPPAYDSCVMQPGPSHAAHAADAASAPPSDRQPTAGERALLAAPDAIVVALVALALAAGLTVSLGAHRPWTTLPAAVLIGWLLWLAVRARSSDAIVTSPL